MKVKEIMSTDLITITKDQKIKDAAKLMTDKKISALLVVNNQSSLVGMLTESDFIGKEIEVPHALASIKQLFGENFYFRDIEKLYQTVREKTIEDVMTTSLHTIGPEAYITCLVNLMIENRLKRIPVVDNGILLGIVTRKDIMRTFSNGDKK